MCMAVSNAPTPARSYESHNVVLQRVLVLSHVQIQEAYESLIKRRGQPQDVKPPGKDSWDFHDWCADLALCVAAWYV